MIRCQMCDGHGLTPQTLPDTAQRVYRDCPECAGQGYHAEPTKVVSIAARRGNKPGGVHPPVAKAPPGDSLEVLARQIEIEAHLIDQACKRLCAYLDRFNKLGGR